MTQKSYFDLGCKLIGLYFLVWAVIGLLAALASIILAIENADALSGLRGLYYVVTPLARILVAVVGLVLIKSRSLIWCFAFREEDIALTMHNADYFTLGVKLYGMILVIGTIPDLLRALSTYLFFAADSPYGTTPAQAQSIGLMTNFFVPIASIMFGVLLFFRGDLLSIWAFAERDVSAGLD